MSNIIIDTPGGIEHFQICQLIARLRIETKTAMTSRVSTLNVVKQRYPEFTKNTKKAALVFMEDFYEKKYGVRYGE